MTKVVKLGRPSKRTQDRERELVRLLKSGNPREVAARCVGIHPATLRRWCALSARFCAVIDQAEAEAEALLVNAVVSAAVAGDWGAAKFWLTHQRSDRWRPPPERQEVDSRQVVIVRQVYDEPAPVGAAAQLPAPPLPAPGLPRLRPGDP